MENRTTRNQESFEMFQQGSRIILRGDLDDSPNVLVTCRAVLEKVPKFSHLTIDAHEARIVPEGVTTWIEAVRQFLMGCELTYAPSQLGLILQYDDRYQHPRSNFHEFQAPAA